MGNIGGIQLADNQDVQYQSAAGRLCNSILVALCLAPLLLLGSVFLLGFNEKRSVCDARAIADGKDKVVEVQCTSPPTTPGALIMFSCPIERNGLPFFSLPDTDFAAQAVTQGTGLRTTAEMLQCVEHSKSESSKSSGGTTTIVTYTYSVEWKDSPVDSGAFHKKSSASFLTNCGAENPSWPAGLPQTKTQYASRATVGPFSITQDYIARVPLDVPVNAPSTPPAWTLTGTGSYTTNKWQVPQQSHGIGQARVSFRSNDWQDPTVTVLGQADTSSTVGPWLAPSSWLCSGSTLSDLRPGVVSKEALFAIKASEAAGLTWALRILGFVVLWFACSLFAAPLGAVADCIPCVGPWLGDKVEAVACCITFFPACACSLGIIGVVWVAMRPAIGIPMILVFLCTLGAGIAFKIRSQQRGGSNQARVPFL